MYICIRIYIYTYMCVCFYTNTCACVRVCVLVCGHAHVDRNVRRRTPLLALSQAILLCGYRGDREALLSLYLLGFARESLPLALLSGHHSRASTFNCKQPQVLFKLQKSCRINAFHPFTIVQHHVVAELNEESLDVVDDLNAGIGVFPNAFLENQTAEMRKVRI